MVILAFHQHLQAVPATPYPVTRILPDGTQLSVLLRGDEFFSYELTIDGYLIRENEDGFYEYAQLIDNIGTVSTGMRVNNKTYRNLAEQLLLRTLEPFPNMLPFRVKSRANKVAELQQSGTVIRSFPRVGSPRSLVILVNFSDVAFVTPNPRVSFTNLLNEPGYSANGSTGSARDYFRTASFGVSSPEFVVVGPYTLPQRRSHYGENDSDDNDTRPRQMVIDACNAAAADGVNFANFDTDNDGVVDNVFIFYAGHNEAEGGPKESIWPHRWALSTPLRLNGKLISGYACSSELRGSTGSNMTGIGTFCHEFGHIYGLPDYYPTNNANHHTLSSWNIMDSGAYLNNGRTPPTFSAYDRFLLGWLAPTILNSPIDVVLGDLQTTNRALIFTQQGTHNLNGSAPNPSEFFILENRQRTGWDAFLPNSGMLITRINYNESTWHDNSVNNTANLMGVDLIEADQITGTATLPGDPFPGSRNVTFYHPTTRSGVTINRPLTDITQSGGNISFRFMGGGNRPIFQTNMSQLTHFNTVLGVPSNEQLMGLSGKQLKGNVTVHFTHGQHFELRRADTPHSNWSKSITLPIQGGMLDSVTLIIRYNPTEASHGNTHFDYLNISSEQNIIEQTTVFGLSTRPVWVVPPIATQPTEINLQGFMASWNNVFDATGYYLTAWKQQEGSTSLKEGFNQGLSMPIGWHTNIETLVNHPSFSGDSVPALQFRNTGDFLETDEFPFPAAQLRFFVRSIGELNGRVIVEGWNGTRFLHIDEFTVGSTLNTVKEYSFTENNNFRKFKIRYMKGNATTSIDDVEVIFPYSIEFNVHNQWIASNSAFVPLILPGKKYYFTVRASDRTMNTDNTVKFENITGYSNIVPIALNQNAVSFRNRNENMRLYMDHTGYAVLSLDSVPENGMLYVFFADGRLFKTLPLNDNKIILHMLPKGSIYILKAGNNAIRVIL